MKNLGIVILYVLAVFAQYRLFLFMKKESRATKYLVATFLLFFNAGTAFFAMIFYLIKYLNIATKLFNEVTQNPNEQMADKLMKHIQEWGITNKPPYWNGLRGAWFAINESSEIPTQKKLQVRNLLTSNGLSLFGNERDIIDNYRQ